MHGQRGIPLPHVRVFLMNQSQGLIHFPRIRGDGIRADDIVTAQIDKDSATLTLTYKIHLKTYDALASAKLHGDLMQAAIEGLEL